MPGAAQPVQKAGVCGAGASPVSCALAFWGMFLGISPPCALQEFPLRVSTSFGCALLPSLLLAVPSSDCSGAELKACWNPRAIPVTALCVGVTVVLNSL